MLFPMTNSILRTAFERIAPHISNLETMKSLVDEIEVTITANDEAIEDAEVTFRTDIRILINDCRHLGDRTTPK